MLSTVMEVSHERTAVCAAIKHNLWNRFVHEGTQGAIFFPELVLEGHKIDKKRVSGFSTRRPMMAMPIEPLSLPG